MKFITVKQLQREFWLPFTVGEAIIREQTQLALNHYLRWPLIFAVAYAAAMVCQHVLDRPWAREPGGTWPLPLLSFVVHHLARRRAQPFILAAARAAAPAD